MFHRLQETLRVTMSKSDVVAKYAEVCSTENWGPTVPQMDELVGIYPQSYYELLPEMQRALDNRAVSWIRCFKTLLIIDHFARNLDQRFMDDLRGFTGTITVIESFHYTDSKGIDRGVSVRERAKKVNALLRDASFLDAERERESRTRGKVAGGGGGAGAKYQGFGSGAAGGPAAGGAGGGGGFGAAARYGGISSSSVAGARLHGPSGDTGASGAHIEKSQAERDHELAMRLQEEFDREARGGPPTGMHHGGGGLGVHLPQQSGTVYRGGGATITMGGGGAGRYGGMGQQGPRYGDSELPPTAFQEQQQQLEIQLQAMRMGGAGSGGSAARPSGATTRQANSASTVDEDYKMALALAGDTPQVFHSAPRPAAAASTPSPQQPRAPLVAAVVAPSPAPVASVPAVVVAQPAPAAPAAAKPDLFGGFAAAPSAAQPAAPAPKPASTLDDIFGGPKPTTGSTATNSGSAGGAGFGDFFSAAPASSSASLDIFAAPRPAAGAGGPPAFGNTATATAPSYQRDAFASLAVTTNQIATTGPAPAPSASLDIFAGPTTTAAARPPANDGWPF